MKNRPEEFYDKQDDKCKNCAFLNTVECLENRTSSDICSFDWSKIVKSGSLVASGLIFLSYAIIKATNFLSQITLEMPRLTYDQSFLLFGIIALAPYLAVKAYESLKKEDVKEDGK